MRIWDWKSRIKMLKTIGCFGVLLLLVGCASDVQYKNTVKSYTVSGSTYYPIKKADGFSETGIASWYGKKFHGRKTASGERYDQNKMTAAHKTLPFGTRVRVKNKDNGKNAVVTINDRGPFVKGRIIDVSRAAAKKLGMINSGTAKVRIEALD